MPSGCSRAGERLIRKRILAFDLATSLRRLKPEKRAGPLRRRPDHALSFFQAPDAGPPLLLDTTVYVDILQDRAPPPVTELLKLRQLNHSAIAVGELTHLFGRLDPAHPETKAVLAPIRATITDMPQHRLSVPSVEAFAEAGIITGTIARLCGTSRQDRQPLLNDACLYLHARESGAVLLTRNVADMDLIDQLAANGRVLFYERVA